jgi:hypothetical protein
VQPLKNPFLAITEFQRIPSFTTGCTIRQQYYTVDGSFVWVISLGSLTRPRGVEWQGDCRITKDCVYPKYHQGICLGVLRHATNILSEDSRCRRRYPNWAPSHYESTHTAAPIVTWGSRQTHSCANRHLRFTTRNTAAPIVTWGSRQTQLRQSSPEVHD